jgi:lipopolysaccharide/colanic/teichoic acid biosynthesis glycosyltransferase
MTEEGREAAGAPAVGAGWYARWGKRAFDVVMAAVILGVLGPLMILVAIAVFLELGRPVLFRQLRPGRGARPFELFKFRTMRDSRDAAGSPLPDGERLTGIGEILRRASIDELPELWNVLRGDMSLVGPRPLLMRYLPYYTELERARFLVRPGITGLAQVSGRNDLRWDDRLAQDVRYVSSVSLGTDLRILALTVARVLSRRGLQVDPGSTMLDLDAERRLKGMSENSHDA